MGFPNNTTSSNGQNNLPQNSMSLFHRFPISQPPPLPYNHIPSNNPNQQQPPQAPYQQAPPRHSQPFHPQFHHNQAPPKQHQAPPNQHQVPPNQHQVPPNQHQTPPNQHQASQNNHETPPPANTQFYSQQPPCYNQGPLNHQQPLHQQLSHQRPPGYNQTPTRHQHSLDPQFPPPNQAPPNYKEPPNQQFSHQKPLNQAPSNHQQPAHQQFSHQKPLNQAPPNHKETPNQQFSHQKTLNQAPPNHQQPQHQQFSQQHPAGINEALAKHQKLFNPQIPNKQPKTRPPQNHQKSSNQQFPQQPPIQAPLNHQLPSHQQPGNQQATPIHQQASNLQFHHKQPPPVQLDLPRHQQPSNPQFHHQQGPGISQTPSKSVPLSNSKLIHQLPPGNHVLQPSNLQFYNQPLGSHTSDLSKQFNHELPPGNPPQQLHPPNILQPPPFYPNQQAVPRYQQPPVAQVFNPLPGGVSAPPPTPSGPPAFNTLGPPPSHPPGQFPEAPPFPMVYPPPTASSSYFTRPQPNIQPTSEEIKKSTPSLTCKDQGSQLIKDWLQKSGKDKRGQKNQKTTMKKENVKCPLWMHVQSLADIKRGLKNVSERITKMEQMATSADSKTWDLCTQELESEQGKFKHLLPFLEKSYDEERLELFKRSKQKRTKSAKSRRLKYERLQLQQAEWEEKSKLIDEWQEKKSRSLKEKNMKKKRKAAADATLSTVTREINDANKLVETLAALQKLRWIRRDAAEKRGDTDIGESRQNFEQKIADMTRLVNGQLVHYKEEEARLKGIIKSEVEESDRKLEENKRAAELMKQEYEDVEMHKLLFGPPDEVEASDPRYPFVQFYKKAEHSLQSFLQIRQEWDSYLVPDYMAGGSEIPSGWVVPDEPSNAQWAMCQS